MEAAAAIALLMVLVLGVIEVAFALYGRNVALASAHEGARAAVELGRSPAEAESIARETARRAAGKLIEKLEVSVSSAESGERAVVRVRLTGRLRLLGPVPLPLPVRVASTASRDRHVQ